MFKKLFNSLFGGKEDYVDPAWVWANQSVTSEKSILNYTKEGSSMLSMDASTLSQFAIGTKKPAAGVNVFGGYIEQVNKLSQVYAKTAEEIIRLRNQPGKQGTMLTNPS
jgi:hypothetical protein